jgi:hypothetical protein
MSSNIRLTIPVDHLFSRDTRSFTESVRPTRAGRHDQASRLRGMLPPDGRGTIQ